MKEGFNKASNLSKVTKLKGKTMSKTPHADTIFALSTPYGMSGVAIIRLSGSGAYGTALKISGKSSLVTRKATLCKLVDPVSRETLDHAVVVYFKNPESYTGEDCVEIHCHGSVAVIEALLEALAKIEGLRLAEPGEFTRRAFENGKMDLTEAEAVADLIHAQTQLQKDQALSQLEGNLGRLYQGWADRLKHALAYVEAAIDFADEELPDNVLSSAKDDLVILKEDIANHLNDNRRGEMLRDGVRVAVIGAPNAGKSTLMNALMRRDVALVSNIPGTTRDVLEGHLNIGGVPVILSDTAGLRPEQLTDEGQDGIEKEGIERALKVAQAANIKILVFDASQEIVNQQNTLQLVDERSILVANKWDEKTADIDEDVYIPISAKNEENLGALLKEIERRAKEMLGKTGSLSLTRKRHRIALEESLEALGRALVAPQIDLMGEDIRLAIRAIGKITGRVDVENLLDVIFQDFCIGK